MQLIGTLVGGGKSPQCCGGSVSSFTGVLLLIKIPLRTGLPYIDLGRVWESSFGSFCVDVSPAEPHGFCA